MNCVECGKMGGGNKSSDFLCSDACKKARKARLKRIGVTFTGKGE